jgi:hypothetical protein
MELSQVTAGKYKMNIWDYIRFQVIVYCTVNHIKTTETLIDTLSLLALLGTSDLKSFCQRLTVTPLSLSTRVKRQAGKDKEYPNIFNSEQSARNFILTLTKLNLIKKDKHNICINPDLKINVSLYTILNYQIVGIDTV